MNRIVSRLEAWLSNCSATIDILDNNISDVENSINSAPESNTRNWREQLNVKTSFNLKPSWSRLIINSHDKVLGILSIYGPESWAPSADELNAIDVSAQLAGDCH